MIGIMDIGGGLRDVYSAGIYDYLIDKNIRLDYCIGVSAGSANLISYVSWQRGRDLKFYIDYAFRKDYMSFNNLYKKKSYIDLDYIYSTLCNIDGENPIDFETFNKSKSAYVAVATEAETGYAHYFNKNDVHQDKYDILKASCAIPCICKPYNIDGKYYYDGGVADPLPYKKAFADGCDKLIAVLTKPIDYIKQQQKFMPIIKSLLKPYPDIIGQIGKRHGVYNESVNELKRLEQEKKVLIVAPGDCYGINTLTKNRNSLNALYNEGYKDAENIERFII